MGYSESKTYHCTAKLEDGSVVGYDGCCKPGREQYYRDLGWDFIGSGVMHEVNGTPQSGRQQYSYFAKP